MRHSSEKYSIVVITVNAFIEQDTHLPQLNQYYLSELYPL